MEQTAGTKRQGTERSAIVAFIAGLLCPGFGQLYAGRARRGIAFQLALIACFTGAVVLLRLHAPVAAIIVLVASGVTTVVAIIDGIVVARRSQAPRGFFGRWGPAIGAAILASMALSMALVYVRASMIETYKVASEAMMPTLRTGDYLLIDVTAYDTAAPQRGDLIALRVPVPEEQAADRSSFVPFIKRVVAVAGDRVELRGTTLRVNGAIVTEPYAIYSGDEHEGFPERTVPGDSVFVLGDNRDNSRDSRHFDPPFVAVENIIGRVEYVYLNARDLSRIGFDDFAGRSLPVSGAAGPGALPER